MASAFLIRPGVNRAVQRALELDSINILVKISLGSNFKGSFFGPIDSLSFFDLYGGLAVLLHFHMPPILKLCIIRLKHSCYLNHTTLKTRVIKSP